MNYIRKENVVSSNPRCFEVGYFRFRVFSTSNAFKPSGYFNTITSTIPSILSQKPHILLPGGGNYTIKVFQLEEIDFASLLSISEI
jgi:hypothetical protein